MEGAVIFFLGILFVLVLIEQKMRIDEDKVLQEQIDRIREGIRCEKRD